MAEMFTWQHETAQNSDAVQRSPGRDGAIKHLDRSQC